MQQNFKRQIEDKLLEWLDMPVKHRESEFEEFVEVPMKDRLAFLVLCNGGFTVQGWGVISGAGNGLRYGLHYYEAYELMTLSGFLNGIALIYGWNLSHILNPLIEDYRARRIAGFNQVLSGGQL